MLKQTISQKMLQKLSPQQIQLMKLLQIPTVNLEQRIKEELEINPALEEGVQEDELGGLDDPMDDEYGDQDADQETFELDDYLNDYLEDDPVSYKLKGDNYSASEEDEKTIPVAVERSFHDHLERQLGLLDFEEEDDEVVALQIIGSIDEDGYLRRDPASIMDDLLFAQNIFTTEEKINDLLSMIQRFDPPGTGARDLQECLIIQLELKLENLQYHGASQAAAMDLALKILREHFDEFAKKHYEKLMRKMDVPAEDLKEAIEEITKLNPKPASGFSGSGPRGSLQYVMPDFIISNREGELHLSLNSRNAPDLHINDQYMDMLRSYRNAQKNKKVNKRDKETVLFIKQKIDSAKWFIDAIRQRQLTLHNTMYAIMQYQYDYFLSGDQKKLRPMILKDIADITGLDISTISRVVNSKYVQTEFGTKLLKDFFSESLQTSDGAEVSTLEVKKILKEMVEGENKRKPLSDEKLKDILQEKGYNIARRTVAKYREQLGIPVARLRKEL